MLRRNRIKWSKDFKILINCILLCLGCLQIEAQSNKKQVLQKQYTAILQEIQQLQHSIDETKKQQSISVHEVSILNTKIDKRKKLIENIEVQKKVIESELETRLSDVQNIDREVQVLKAEYAKLIVWLNKNHHTVNKLAFVLEANNFKEAYHRIQYIKKYGDYRAKQSSYLTNQIQRILEKINALNLTKKEKINIIQANQHQQKVLLIEKQSRDSLVAKLGKDIGDLKSKVREKNQKAASINARIKKIIEEEITKQREKQMAEIRSKREKEKKSNPKSKTPAPSEEITQAEIQKSPEGILSTSFQNSRGNLPWPVSNGVVTGKFGRQPHPADPEIFVDNNGIDIKTIQNADVKSIYKGTVVRIFDMPTYQTCIMVKHGDFFSVYSYLKSVNVREGMDIDAGQSLGKCGFDETHGYSLVNLQIWHYQNKQNPQSWLSGR